MHSGAAGCTGRIIGGPGQRRPAGTAAARGRAEPPHHWSRHAPDLALAALVAPSASRVPVPEVPAAASSPVSSAASRRAAVPQTWPARIAALGRWRLLTWPCSTAGGSIPRNHGPASSLQAPAPAGYSPCPEHCSLPVLPPRAIMEVLGHAEIGVTMNTYTHVLPELREEAADAI